MAPPNITIIVVPRERFSFTQASLESIYEHTTLPFELIYIDGHSPLSIQEYLEQQAQIRGFELIRSETYLSPNRARNIGLSRVKTPYLVFIDNDVIVSSGWLTSLVNCARDTQAAVVGPLMCEGAPVHTVVHFAGGESHIWTDKLGRRRLREKMLGQGKKVSDIREQLTRQETELAEFHCVLVRTDIFETIGLLDEGLLNTKEHLDFCMTVAQLGHSVYFEPNAIVTYVPGPPLQWGDLAFYALRWSDAWTLSSLHHMRKKWNLAEDGYFKTKYKKLGWRRRVTLIRPFCQRLLFGVQNRYFEAGIARLEKIANRYLTTRHAQQLTQAPQIQHLSHPRGEVS